MKRIRRALICLLCLLTLSASVCAAGMAGFEKTKTYDGRFTDVSGWYVDYVTAAYESGLLNGTSNTAFSPDATLRLCEVVTVAARIHSQYKADNTDFTAVGGDWYAPYYDYCIASGLFTEQAFPYASMPQAATRAQVVTIFSGVLPDTELPAINTVEDDAIPDVPASAAGADVIYRFYRAGVLTGSGASHAFNGASSIKRSEMAAIVARLTNLSPRASVTLTVSSLYQSRTDAILVDGQPYWLGMSAVDLFARAGLPDETLATFAGFQWQVYGTDTYEDFFLARVEDGKVTSLYASCPTFSYLGQGFGDTARQGDHVFYLDSNAETPDSIYAVRLGDHFLGSSQRDAYADECKLNFHLTNAFRACYGLPALQWSADAAACAEKHSRDMADSNYFSHTSLTGTSPGDRLNAAGIDWRSYGENIAAGYIDAIGVHDGWVNSAGHRSNMLQPIHTYLGVGYAFSEKSNYFWYWTQNFYTAW